MNILYWREQANALSSALNVSSIQETIRVVVSRNSHSLQVPSSPLPVQVPKHRCRCCYCPSKEIQPQPVTHLPHLDFSTRPSRTRQSNLLAIFPAFPKPVPQLKEYLSSGISPSGGRHFGPGSSMLQTNLTVEAGAPVTRHLFPTITILRNFS